MAFEKIVGHKKVISLIKADIYSGNVSHAYLFSGSNSLGKLTVAREMAKMLQCEDHGCGSCDICRQIEKGVSVDTEFLPDVGESFKAEEMRDFVLRVQTSGQGKYRIFVIQNIERMTPDAANTFLKVLEEPPVGTIYLMTTGNISRVLQTILSRVRVLSFSPVSEDEIREGIDKFAGSNDAIKLTELSMGKPALAFKMARDNDLLRKYEAVFKNVEIILGEFDLVDKFRVIENLAEAEKEEKGGVNLFFEVMIFSLRKILLQNPDKELGQYLEMVVDTQRAVLGNINPRLALENLVI